MSHVDLSGLRMAEPAAAIPPRPLGPRLVAGAAILLALVVALTFVWRLLHPVRTVPTVAVRAAAAQLATAIAEAAGWIEPDPFPVLVRPLVSGRIESIEVLEGAPLQAGKTTVARLASASLLAAKERAAAALAERDGELLVAEATAALAKAQLAQKAQLRTAVATARLAVEEREARLAAARGARERARAETAGAAAAREAQEQLAAIGGAHAVALARAAAAVQAAAATAAAAEQEFLVIERELAAARTQLALAEELFADPVDLRGAAAVADAALGEARLARAAAAAELAIAARELQWTEVKAPVDGVVLRLLAMPGAMVGPDGEGILTVYDQRRLRARIDVPLGSVAAIRDGQAVELRSEVLGGAVARGTVQRVQRESDLLKNTLQVKVGIEDPPALLRPETLCRARFLGGDGAGAAAGPAAFLVPKAALQGGHVFVFDPARRRARAVPVQVVQDDADAVVVRGELSVAQRVIVVPVQDGEPVCAEEP